MPVTYPRTKAYPGGAVDGQRLPAAKLNIIDENAAHSADPQYTTVTTTGNASIGADLSAVGNIASSGGSVSAAGNVTAGDHVTAVNGITSSSGALSAATGVSTAAGDITTLNGDISTAVGDVEATTGNLRGKKVIQLGTQATSWIRVAPCDMTNDSNGGVPFEYKSGATGGMVATGTDSEAFATLNFSFHVPKGAVISEIVLAMKTPGDEDTDRVSFFHRCANGTQVNIAENAAVTHTGNSYDIAALAAIDSLPYTDTQSSGSPTVVGTVKYYVVEYLWNYDVSAGGSQTCIVSGAWIGWHYPDGAQLVNGT